MSFFHLFINHSFNLIPQGLEVGDEIVQFGSVSSENFRNLQQIGEVVQHSVGVSICVGFNRLHKSYMQWPFYQIVL